MQPKNAHRRDAIAAKTYREIVTQDDATAYLMHLLLSNLQIEFAGREGVIRQEIQAMIAAKGATLFLAAPDIYYAAAVMVVQGFYLGKGDRTQIIMMIVKRAGECKAVRGKLVLLQKGMYMGTRLYKDEFKASEDKWPLSIG